MNSTTDFCTLSGRVSRVSAEKFLFGSAEKFPGGNLLCFRKYLVSKNVKDMRGGASRLSVENLLSHLQKKPVEEPFCVSESFGYQKKYA